MPGLNKLTDPSLTIIFATSPTGLGHLRVTDALYHGLPQGANPVLLGAQDNTAETLYRFVSTQPFTRRIMEMVQLPPFDKPFAVIGRNFLRSNTKLIYQQLKTILEERLVVPKTVLLVAPHTILGHQLGAIKDQLAREMGVTILLIVQVTDDSPQAIWYVYDADLILVPSHYTKEHLLEYARKAGFPMVPMVVTAYPISPQLAEALPEHAFEQRQQQTNPNSAAHINMLAPVSGAAVGTSFLATYIKKMHKLSERFVFHVVSREAPYTNAFLRTMSQLSYVHLHASIHDRTTVDNYEQVFKQFPVSLEITKPSEQTFKALATPRQRGGVIMLFSKPVGGQEYDNLHFLRNHGLMPTKQENYLLWDMAQRNESIASTDLLTHAHRWRAILLPEEAETAAAFTLWCLRENIFSAMFNYERAQKAEELQSNGVEQFWTQVVKLLDERIA